MEGFFICYPKKYTLIEVLVRENCPCSAQIEHHLKFTVENVMFQPVLNSMVSTNDGVKCMCSPRFKANTCRP